MPLWGTCYQEGQIQADRYLRTSRPPSSAEAGLNLVHVHQEPYKVPWSYWFDYISPNQFLLDEVILHLAAGHRFCHLVAVATCANERQMEAAGGWTLLH